ncbi:hypothetical protein NDU88_007213 [Pleurodeles waltl]|uniref:Uncharacterized protein n=1 Tax=Pleurodeles waltl TaxID=8319 RepID=A0AAV7N2T8_PLEWA|nr:hypothetical protein NDU88_007213 [Pleurodeles waltl]
MYLHAKCKWEPPDWEEDAGAPAENEQLLQFPGGTTESSPPGSLYDFEIQGQREKDDGEKGKAHAAGETENAREGAIGCKADEAPGTEKKQTEVRKKEEQEASESGRIERQQGAQEAPPQPCFRNNVAIQDTVLLKGRQGR